MKEIIDETKQIAHENLKRCFHCKKAYPKDYDKCPECGDENSLPAYHLWLQQFYIGFTCYKAIAGYSQLLNGD